MTFAEAFATQQRLAAESKDALNQLRAVPGNASGPMGLTPDAVRARPDWQAANAALARVLDRERKFNADFTKRFKKDLTAWRRGGGRYFDPATWPR